MPVTIHMRQADVTARVQNDFDNKVLPLLSEIILQDTNEFCKEDTGMLIASSLSHSVTKEGKLVWETPYAKRQYWEIRTAFTDVNPRATWRWCEYAKNAYLSKWQTQAQRLVDRL